MKAVIPDLASERSEARPGMTIIIIVSS